MTLKTPPFPFTSSRMSSREASATSSPKTTMRGSRFISSFMHEFNKSTTVRSLSDSYSGVPSVSKSSDVGSVSSEKRCVIASDGSGCGDARAMSAASATAASISASISSSWFSVAAPIVISRSRVRRRGSCNSWCSRSSGVL